MSRNVPNPAVIAAWAAMSLESLEEAAQIARHERLPAPGLRAALAQARKAAAQAKVIVPAKPEAAKPAPAKPEAAKPAPAKPEAAKPAKQDRSHVKREMAMRAPAFTAAQAPAKPAKPAPAAQDLSALLARAMEIDPSIRGQVLMALAGPVIAAPAALENAAPAKPEAAKPAQAPAFTSIQDQIANAKREIALRAKPAQAPAAQAPAAQAPAAQAPAAQAPAAPAKRSRKSSAAQAPAAPAKPAPAAHWPVSDHFPLAERFAVQLGKAAARAWADISELGWHWKRESDYSYTLTIAGTYAPRAAKWADVWLRHQPEISGVKAPAEIGGPAGAWALTLTLKPEVQVAFQ